MMKEEIEVTVVSKYKPKINTKTSKLLSQPVTRFKHIKKKVGPKMWKHYEKYKWILQISYSYNIETKKLDWHNVVDEYFLIDEEGLEQSITHEQYLDDII